MVDSDPPGVEGVTGFAAVVVVVATAALLVVVVVFGAAVVVVFPAPAVVVLVAAPDPLVVVVTEFPDLCVLSDVFLDADGEEEPQAAAIRPPARMTRPMAKVRPKRRSPLLVDVGESVVVCKVFLPHSSCSSSCGAGPGPTSATGISPIDAMVGPEGGGDS